jgi:hypothetical protein
MHPLQRSSLQPPAQPLPLTAVVATTENAFQIVRGRGFERQQARARSCVIDRGQHLPTQTLAEPVPVHTQTWSEDRRWRLFSVLPPAPRPRPAAHTWRSKRVAARQGRQANLVNARISRNRCRAANACLPVLAHHERQLAAGQSSVEFPHVQDFELETWLHAFLPSSEACAARARAAMQASRAATPDGQAVDSQTEPLSDPKPEQFEPASNGAKATPTATANKDWQLQKAHAFEAVRRTMLKLRASTNAVCTLHTAVLRCARLL